MSRPSEVTKPPRSSASSASGTCDMCANGSLSSLALAAWYGTLSATLNHIAVAIDRRTKPGAERLCGRISIFIGPRQRKRESSNALALQDIVHGSLGGQLPFVIDNAVSRAGVAHVAD